MVPDAVQAGWRKVFGGKRDDEESELEVDDSLDDIDEASSVGDAERDVGDDEHLLYWEVGAALDGLKGTHVLLFHLAGCV